MGKRLDWFKSEAAKTGLDIGAVSASLFHNYIRFEVYTNLRLSGMKKQKALLKVAKDTKCSRTTMQRVVDYFQEE